MALDVELAEIRDFLAVHEPFAGLPREVLEALPARLELAYHRRGTDVIGLGSDNHHLVVLRSGAVDVRDAQGTLVERGEAGTSFGSIALTQGNPSTFTVTAIEDCLVLLLPAADFERLSAEHPDFAAFYDDQRRSRLGGAVADLQATGSGSAILKTHVRDLVTRDPVAVDGATSVRDAARLMAREHVSSLLVIDDGHLSGVVTDRDLRTRVLAADVDPGRPLREVMTPDPVTESVDALAFEALLTMTRRRIHHLPLVDASGRPVGLVTTTDLLRIEETNPVYLTGDIDKQTDVAGVARVSARLPQVVRALAEQDATAEDIGRVVTAVGDSVERRLVALAEAELGPAPAAYCWVTLGSRARFEQALAADQDTALLLDDDVREADLPWFEQLAERVVAGLEQCGYPRCRGEVMATNPRWRRPLGQWREEFTTWLGAPTPEAVLHSSIFFDMRPVHGDVSLHARLQQHVQRGAPGATRFLSHLAKHAVAHEPPLGFFRGFVLERAGEHAHTLDLKAGGVLPVVELARVHALAVGSPATHTRARLQAACEAGAISAQLAEDLRDAFEFLGYVRLRHQSEQVRAGRPTDNHVAPSTLSGFDKRHLRHAFSIVRLAQQALERRYLTSMVS